MQVSPREPLQWREDKMLDADDAFLKIMKTIISVFRCFQNIQKVIHFNRILFPYSQIKLKKNLK